MNLYLVLKHTHMSLALLSFSGFALRGVWMLTERALLHHKLTRILPHIVDTLLLVSAIALVVMSRQYPFVVGWVTLKVGLLLVYIGFGAFALNRGKTRQVRVICFGCAIGTILLIFWTAFTKPVLTL